MKLVSLVGALVFGALVGAAPLALGAQQASPAAAHPVIPPGFEVPKDMATYYLAIYVKGPKHMTGETPEHAALTKEHLRYIRRMIEEKKYMFAGPLLDDGDKQGIATVSAANAREAKHLTDGDPAIAAGHMAVELHAAMLPSLSSLVVRY